MLKGIMGLAGDKVTDAYFAFLVGNSQKPCKNLNTTDSCNVFCNLVKHVSKLLSHSPELTTDLVAMVDGTDFGGEKGRMLIEFLFV